LRRSNSHSESCRFCSVLSIIADEHDASLWGPCSV
jgi:hypothetical protein